MQCLRRTRNVQLSLVWFNDKHVNWRRQRKVKDLNVCTCRRMSFFFRKISSDPYMYATRNQASPRTRLPSKSLKNPGAAQRRQQHLLRRSVPKNSVLLDGTNALRVILLYRLKTVKPLGCRSTLAAVLLAMPGHARVCKRVELATLDDRYPYLLLERGLGEGGNLRSCKVRAPPKHISLPRPTAPSTSPPCSSDSGAVPPCPLPTICTP